MGAPDFLTIIDWSLCAMNELSKNQIIKSFVSTGIVKELTELKQRELLHSRLSQLIDEYLDGIGHDRNLLDDVEALYADATEMVVKRLGNEQELEMNDAWLKLLPSKVEAVCQRPSCKYYSHIKYHMSIEITHFTKLFYFTLT